MAKLLLPAPVTVTLVTSARVAKSTKPSALSGLRPFKLRVFDSPSYRMRSGFPVDVPQFDVRSDHLVSATGEKLAFRPGPRDVDTAANVRWVADPDFYEDTTFNWLPIRSDLGPITWDSSDVYSPVLIEDYTYSINKERFTVAAMNFDRDRSEHMWTTTTALTGSQGFTVIMVCTMNSAFGNTNEAGFSGIFGSGKPSGLPGMQSENVTNPFGIRLAENNLKVVAEDRVAASLGIAGLMSRSAPMYLVFAMGRPSSVVYAGKGPTSMARIEVASGTSEDRYYGDFVLGRSYGDTLHTADMAVMEFGLYADKLSDQQVREEIATLSSVYGGES